MKIISVLRHSESSIGANEAGHIEGEGSVVCKRFANQRKICVFSTFYEATGSNKTIQTVPLHRLYFSLEMRTSCLFMCYTPSKLGNLVLQAWILIPFLLDQHDNSFKGRSRILLIDSMLIYPAQFGRALGGLIIFLFAHRQEIILQSGFFEL